MHFPIEFLLLGLVGKGSKWLGGKGWLPPKESGMPFRSRGKVGYLGADGKPALDEEAKPLSAKQKAAIMKKEGQMKAAEMGIEVKPEKKKGKRKSPVSGISSSIDLTEDKSGNPQVIHKPTGLGVFSFSPGTTMDGLKEASPAVAKQRAKALAQELSQYDWINDADLPKNRPHLKQIAIHVEKARFGYDMKEAEASVNKWWKS